MPMLLSFLNIYIWYYFVFCFVRIDDVLLTVIGKIVVCVSPCVF